MKLELYYYDQCPFCAMVVSKIKALDLESKIQFKNVLENPEFKKYHKETTGRNTVPCLYINDEPMFESMDIMAWLDKHQTDLKES